MGKKAKRARKKERREADSLAEAAAAVRERGARARLAPELWVAERPAVDATATGPRPGVPSSTARATGDAAELAARLAGLSTVLQRQLARADAGEGLTRARLSALSLLVLGGPRRLGELAAAERVRPPTMTRLVRAMEADGLVTRDPDPSDRRSVVIHATPVGEAQLELGRSRQLAPLAAAIAGLDEGEHRVLEDGTGLIERLVRAAGRPPGHAPA